MTDQSGTKLQSFRTVMEAIVVALLVWVGSSLVGLKTDIAVIQSQLAYMNTQVSDVPAIKTSNLELKLRVENLEKGFDELKKVKNLGDR